jgi:hypothetical protein
MAQTSAQPHRPGRGCQGKRSYESFLVAQRMARNTRRHRDARVHAYHCHHCHLFHVGENDDYVDRHKLHRGKA